MTEAPENIISDEEITRVHAYANFGDMSPREVVNRGVRKYAVGFTCGYTMTILREHRLITKPKGYQASLTEKGKRYARSIWDDTAAYERGWIAGLRQAAHVASNACLVPPDGGSPTEDEVAVCDEAYRRILALIPDAQEGET